MSGFDGCCTPVPPGIPALRAQLPVSTVGLTCAEIIYDTPTCHISTTDNPTAVSRRAMPPNIDHQRTLAATATATAAPGLINLLMKLWHFRQAAAGSPPSSAHHRRRCQHHHREFIFRAITGARTEATVCLAWQGQPASRQLVPFITRELREKPIANITTTTTVIMQFPV